MFTVSGRDITISRGDTGTLTVTLTGDVPDDNTVALVTVRRDVNKTDTVWEKRINILDGAIVIPLTTADTDIPWFDYVWDIRLLYQNGDIYTPFEPALFRVCEVVGDV